MFCFIVLSDEERFERKRHSAALYQKYLNRSGPKHLGTKDMPEVRRYILVLKINITRLPVQYFPFVPLFDRRPI